jgi:hypothetical protein
MGLARTRRRRHVPITDAPPPADAISMTIRGNDALMIDVTDDPMWNHFFYRVDLAVQRGIRMADAPLSLTHDDQFWAFGEPPRLYRVVEWL